MNTHSNNEDEGLETQDRLCVCDCSNGRFVTNITKAEIGYIFEIITKHNANTGDFVSEVVAEGALEKLEDMKSYVNKPDRDQ